MSEPFLLKVNTCDTLLPFTWTLGNQTFIF